MLCCQGMVDRAKAKSECSLYLNVPGCAEVLTVDCLRIVRDECVQICTDAKGLMWV